MPTLSRRFPITRVSRPNRPSVAASLMGQSKSAQRAISCTRRLCRPLAGVLSGLRQPDQCLGDDNRYGVLSEPSALSPRLDLTFKIGLLLKAADGVLEIVGGVLLSFLSPARIEHIVRTLTTHELAQDPHDLIARPSPLRPARAPS